MNLEVTDTSSQLNPEQMDEEFTTTAYSNVQENLKLPTEGEVRLEEPASSAGTLSSLQNLNKELSFTDQFLVEKSQEDKPEKTNTEAEVQSMVTVPIHQDTSRAKLWRKEFICGRLKICLRTQEIDRKIEESVKEAVTASVQYAMRAPLRARFKDLPTSDIMEILLQRMLEENYNKGHEDHKMAYEALQTSILHDEREQFDADKDEKLKKMKGKQDSPKIPPGSPPPPPPPVPPSGASGAFGTTGASDSTQNPLPPLPHPTTHHDDQSQGSAAPGSSKTAASTEYTA
ncbi:hypothetical protein Tco_1277814 [Tanacetum coccineum]